MVKNPKNVDTLYVVMAESTRIGSSFDFGEADKLAKDWKANNPEEEVYILDVIHLTLYADEVGMLTTSDMELGDLAW